MSYQWSLGLQQAMVFLLVAGRWFLPKGKMTREKLSNLLLAYIGMAADILEFLSEGVQSDQVRCNRMIVLVILCLWSISLLQFSFELNHHAKQRSKSLSHVNETFLQRCLSSEVWGIIIVIVMQDGPFLGVRLYLIAEYKIFEQGLLFFTFKNLLIVMLQLYRLWILLCLTQDTAEGKFSLRLLSSLQNRSRSSNREERQNPLPFDREDDEVFDVETEMGRSHRNLALVVDDRPKFKHQLIHSSQNVPQSPPAYRESSNEFNFPPHLPHGHVHHHHVHDHHHNYVPTSHPSYLDANNLPPRNARGQDHRKSTGGKKEGRRQQDLDIGENWQMRPQMRQPGRAPVLYEEEFNRNRTSKPYNPANSWAIRHFGGIGVDAPLY